MCPQWNTRYIVKFLRSFVHEKSLGIIFEK